MDWGTPLVQFNNIPIDTIGWRSILIDIDGQCFWGSHGTVDQITASGRGHCLRTVKKSGVI